MLKRINLLLFFFSAAIAYNPEKAIKLLQEATKEYYSGASLNKTIKKLERAHELDPENMKISQVLSRFLSKLGKRYFSDKNYQKALKTFERALKLDSSNTVAKGYYNLTLLKLKKTPKKLTAKKTSQKKKIIKKPLTKEEEIVEFEVQKESKSFPWLIILVLIIASSIGIFVFKYKK